MRSIFILHTGECILSICMLKLHYLENSYGKIIIVLVSLIVEWIKIYPAMLEVTEMYCTMK